MNINKLRFLIVCLCLPFFLYAQNFGYHDIQWRNDLSWDEVKALAKKEGRNIFLDCYATWCVPCKLMDLQVYSNDTIVEYFNKNFISVRLQMDTTSHDNDVVKSWFPLKDQIKKSFRVTDLPTLVFLSSEDNLLDKQTGYQNVQNLLASAKAIPTKILLYNKLEEYKKGKRDYTILLELAQFVKNTITDEELSNKIANDYKEGYLEHLGIDSLLTTKNLQFAYSYSQIISSKDHIFRAYYQYPQRIDSVFGKAVAMKFVNWLVAKEELLDKVTKDNKPVGKREPDWNLLKTKILNKYPNLDANTIVNNFCITYYRNINLNWSNWTHYKNIRIKTSPPDYKDYLGTTQELNDNGAWDVFANCNQKSILKIALDWINMAIQFEEKRKPGIPNAPYLDTKANLLYKLGNIKDAIKTEQDAIKATLNSDMKYRIKNYQEVLEQMKTGEPTYIKSGAIWDERTFPVKTSSNNLSSK